MGTNGGSVEACADTGVAASISDVHAAAWATPQPRPQPQSATAVALAGPGGGSTVSAANKTKR